MRLSLAGLLVCAAVFGGIWGLRAGLPGETEIITAVAEAYVAATGGALTDCFARPSELDGVRLVVICGDGGEGGTPWVRAYDDWGRDVTDAVALAVEPQA